MNTLEKYEDIKVSMLQEKTRDTLEKLQKATKNFTIENDKAIAYVNAVHSKLSKEKPEALRSKDVKDEPKPEPKKSEPKKPAVKKAVTKKAEPKKAPTPEPTPKPKVTKTQIKTATAKINALKLAIDTDPLLKGLGKTDKERDASRLAQPKGRRTSKVGWKNQYGTSKGGRVYYESRENRSDRKSPEYKSGYPFLEMGGYTHRIDSGIMANGGEMDKMELQETRIKFKIASVIGIDKALRYSDMDFAVSPFQLIRGAVVKGFITIDEINEDLFDAALSESYQIDEMYKDSGQGIGGSDMNAFIANMLNDVGIRVKVVNNRWQRMADGGFMAKGGQMDKRREYFQGTMSDDALKSILDYEYPNNSFSVEYDSISGTKIYGERADLLNAQTKLKDIYKIKTTLMGENQMGLKYLSAPSQFVYFANGGFMAKGGEMGKIDEVDSDEIDKAFSNFEDFANGGSMKLDWEKADVGDSALVIAENKMGVIVKTYGRRFHLRFPDGSDKTYSAEDLKFFFDDEYAEGGTLKNTTYLSQRNIEQVTAKIGGKSVVIDGSEIVDGLYRKNSVKGNTADENYVVVSEKDEYWYIMSTPSTKVKAQQLLKMTTIPRGEIGKVVTIDEAKNHKKVIGKKYLSKTTKPKGIVVTSIKDIPNFDKRLDEGKITYRGLGMGKLSNDFFKETGTIGYRIKVDGKEYFITDEEFDTFSRGADGKLRVRFAAPTRKSYEQGGEVKSSEKLPYKLDKYFIKGAKTIEVPLAQLFPLRARETGIENAEKFMRMAYNGDMERRKPISIYLMSKGKYKIADGNSTFAVAKKNGWKTIYADVIKNPKSQSNGQKSVFSIAKEIRKDGESWQSAIQRAKMMK